MNVHNQLLMRRLNASTAMLPVLDKPSSANNLLFTNGLKSSLASLEQMQLSADKAVQGLVSGEADNLHQVMIQTSEAQISLELAVQLRNKCIEAMNEMKNMQF